MARFILEADDPSGKNLGKENIVRLISRLCCGQADEACSRLYRDVLSGELSFYVVHLVFVLDDLSDRTDHLSLVKIGLWLQLLLSTL